VFRPEFLERRRLRRGPLPGEIRSERFQAVLGDLSGEIVTAVDKLAVLTIVPADGSKRAPRSALQVINQVLVRAHIDGMPDSRIVLRTHSDRATTIHAGRETLGRRRVKAQSRGSSTEW
jgi:hypothetical protein